MADVDVVYVIGVQGVFRKCGLCLRWRSRGNFQQRGLCGTCTRQRRLHSSITPGKQVITRSIVITDKGHEALRRLGVPRKVAS
jgi:hypothetical protein